MYNQKYLLIAICLVLFTVITKDLSARQNPEKIDKFSDNFPTYYDLETYLTAENILLFSSCIGTIGTDTRFHFGRFEGCYYPFSGDTMNIIEGQDFQTVLYSAGLVLVGKVGDSIRSAVGMYDYPEFRPGPMPPGGIDTLLTGNVFKIDELSGSGDYDYDNWPIGWGAPSDDGVTPKLLGSQTVWSIYNDDSTALHRAVYGGGTDPLGVEVQQTLWADADEADVVYLKYKLYNRGANQIDSFYICFWADPDIGGPNDDLVGCDSLHDIFYCYNGYDFDYLYDDLPPAWGGTLISGPIIYSHGDTAQFEDNLIIDHANIGMTSFNSYLSGNAPLSPEQLFLSVRGYDNSTYLPMTDPITGETTTYYAHGNPLTHSGWIDSGIGDKKIMVGFGPLQFNPGDSQVVELKLGAYQRENNLLSLSYLRNILDSTVAIDSVIDTTTYFAADSVKLIIDDFGLRSVLFEPHKGRWLDGFNWGGRYYGGGFDYSSTFMGSGLNPDEQPDSFHNIEIRFSPTNRQMAYCYLLAIDTPYNYSGYFEVPFTVWDTDNNRQLNIAFTERADLVSYDSTWGPPDDDDRGGHEFIFIFNSDYSGEDPYNSMLSYPDYNLLNYIDSLDLLYFFWPTIRDGNSIVNLDEGQLIKTKGQFENQNGLQDTVSFITALPGEFSSQTVRIKCFSEEAAIINLIMSDSVNFDVSSSRLKFRDSLAQTISITFHPQSEGQFSEYLSLVDSISGTILNVISLIGGSVIQTDITADDRMLIPSDYYLGQNYPNPFNPSTLIDFSLPKQELVTLTIYNILGQRVKTLINSEMRAGYHRARWDGTNDRRQSVAAGIYFYRLQTSQYSRTAKMLLLK